MPPRMRWSIRPPVFCSSGICAQSQPPEDGDGGRARDDRSTARKHSDGGAEDEPLDALRRHFLSNVYALGGDLGELEAQDGGYVLEATEWRVPVYRHEESNIRVWRQALRLALPGETNVEVFFHYTTSELFHEVATAACITPDVWAGMKQVSVEGGWAVYAASQEPAQFMGPGCKAEQLPRWILQKEFCIPLLIPGKSVCNADFPEDTWEAHVQDPGVPHRGRDMWIVAFSDEMGALMSAALDIEHRFRRVLRASEAELGPNHRETLDAAGYLAYLLDAAGKADEAEPLYRRALEGYEALLSWEHSETLRTASNLAALLQAQSRLDEAEPLARRALRGLERKFGAVHQDTMASVGNLAHLLNTKGELEEAAVLFRRLLAWRETRLGGAHPDSIMCAADLALCLAGLGRHAEAVALERNVLKQREATLGPRHPDTLRSQEALASELELLGALGEAEELRRLLLLSYTAAVGRDSPDTLVALLRFARLRQRRGDFVGAEPLLRQCVELSAALLGERHPEALNCVASLAAVLVGLQRDQEAAELLEAHGLPRTTTVKEATSSPSASEPRSTSSVSDIRHGFESRQGAHQMPPREMLVTIDRDVASPLPGGLCLAPGDADDDPGIGSKRSVEHSVDDHEAHADVGSTEDRGDEPAGGSPGGGTGGTSPSTASCTVAVASGIPPPLRASAAGPCDGAADPKRGLPCRTPSAHSPEASRPVARTPADCAEPSGSMQRRGESETQEHGDRLRLLGNVLVRFCCCFGIAPPARPLASQQLLASQPTPPAKEQQQAQNKPEQHHQQQAGVEACALRTEPSAQQRHQRQQQPQQQPQQQHQHQQQQPQQRQQELAQQGLRQLDSPLCNAGKPTAQNAQRLTQPGQQLLQRPQQDVQQRERPQQQHKQRERQQREEQRSRQQQQQQQRREQEGAATEDRDDSYVVAVHMLQRTLPAGAGPAAAGPAAPARRFVPAASTLAAQPATSAGGPESKGVSREATLLAFPETPDVSGESEAPQGVMFRKLSGDQHASRLSTVSAVV